MCRKITWLYWDFLLTCKRPPARACCYPEYVWAAQSLEASGTYPGAGWQPSEHSGSVSSKWWNAPGPSCQTNTGQDGEWARAGMGSCPACSLETGIGTLSVLLNSLHFVPTSSFFPFLPSAIAPSTRMPDSLTTHSGWKSSSLSKGRICSSSSSLNTLANTSNAAAEHLPNVWSEVERHIQTQKCADKHHKDVKGAVHTRQVINTLYGS